MKCRNCGLPLSPNNTQMICPRCHATSPSGPEIAVGNAFPPVAQIPFPQPGQIWNATPTPTLSPRPTPTAIPIAPTPTPGMFELIDNNQSYPSLPPLRTTGNMYASTNLFEQPRAGRVKSNLGFIVATIFVATGALLLVLVYILALGLPMHNPTSALIGTLQATRSILPTPTTAASTPTTLPTPTTSAFPGQQYIDNPQMASTINFNTAQPIQTTTTFKVKQRIYVTFAIHPNGKSGAICLYWYLNNHAVTEFPFPVTAAASAAYSYAIYGGRGNGYVEIYWASTTACSDRMLAQHVTFTVTA